VTERYHREARAFGRPVLDTLKARMAAVSAARDGPPVDLPAIHADALAKLRAAGEQAPPHDHAKTPAWAGELLNDGDALFQVLHPPARPLTHTEAGRARRHGVIVRTLSDGTRTATGSRIFAPLASVIDPCRKRGHSPWLYPQTAIADRRADRALAPLPQ